MNPRPRITISPKRNAHRGQYLFCDNKTGLTLCWTVWYKYWRRNGNSHGSFLEHLRSYEKRLLASSYVPTCPNETTCLPLDGFSWNMIVGTSTKICPQKINSVNIGQKYQPVHNIWYFTYNTSLNSSQLESIFTSTLMRQSHNSYQIRFRNSCYLQENYNRRRW
jgi:hypothetical protein